MSFTRVLVLCAVLMMAFAGRSSGDLVVGSTLVKTEGIFSGTSITSVTRLELPAKRRLVVSAAAQYAIDFGIIPEADLKKWRRFENPRFLMRLSGETNTRYITLNEGSYYVVARDLNGGTANNGYMLKVRLLTGSVRDGSAKRSFLSNKVMSSVVAPFSWDGFAFSRGGDTKMWIDGVFGRGADRKVKWEIVSGREYEKFRAGRPYEVLLTGSNPKQLAFEFKPKGGPYYFLLINRAGSYSAFTVTRELYR